MDIPNLILFIFYVVSTMTLLYLFVKSNIQRRKLLATYIQSEFDKYFINQKLEEVLDELSKKQLQETDGFIKFVSQSRDWAFEYIEEVQAALAEFDKEVSSKFKWARTFGKTIDGGTHGKVLDEISLAYDKLKTVLPKETETPNN